VGSYLGAAGARTRIWRAPEVAMLGQATKVWQRQVEDALANSFVYSYARSIWTLL
jgi:hypothetical protein